MTRLSALVFLSLSLLATGCDEPTFPPAPPIEDPQVPPTDRARIALNTTDCVLSGMLPVGQ